MIRKTAILSLLVRTSMFALLWALLSKNTWHDPILIAAVVIAAVATSFALWPVDAWKWRLVPLLKFAPYFLRESLDGGIDVARRAFSPKLPLEPRLIDYPLGLRSEAARVFFSWTVSLLPGTASVRLGADSLRVHVLDQRLPVTEKLRQLEGHVAAMFGEPAPDG